MSISREILDYYGAGREAERLAQGLGPLELVRTQELIVRYLPPPPAVIYDIGGGPGVYSFWLAGLGYRVHLVDAVPLHIEQAKQASRAPHAPQLASMQVGDARDLDFPGDSADAVVLHGPLYHLTERQDRLSAITEARRLLRTGGVLLAFAITRYASMLVGLQRGWIWDIDFWEMIREELETGQHRPPASWPDLFTTAFFHHPDELRAEVEDAGMVHENTLAVQGPAWMAADFSSSWKDEARREVILSAARMMENEPVMSPHFLAIARKSA